ncbi:hypothetical protein FBUS_04392 [Fasciolopsis buskii]|uniref:Uncharacterized protein n=1 Tax=Fasciolopsis buskii TaxID=27845 RepID=A0A8E0RTT5_9TREM|nr:hypothetical protein FBUS_04392 [Fasciolopsis buski]
MRPTASLWHKLPRRSVTTVVQNDTQNLYMDHEYCFLVDTEDRPVGTASKKVCHERKYSQRPPLHRAFSLFLYAPKKDADCGSLFHELGIRSDQYMPLEHVHFLTRILYYAPNSESADQRWAEHELDGLLVSVLSHDPEANPSSVWMRCNSDEVSATRWISRSELDSLVRSDSSDGYSIHNQWTLDSLTPWFRTLLTTGLLHRVWDWAEAYWNRQSDSLRFKSENQQWDRDRIYRLSCS